MTIGNDPKGAVVRGDLGGFVSVPYSFGDNAIMDHLNTAYYHIHGQPFVYPTLANNVVLTAGAGAWGTGGSIIEVIPANALSVSAFDLHWLNVSALSENAEYEIWIYSGLGGAEVKIGATRPVRNAVQSTEGARRIQIAQQPPNTRISCKLFSSVAGASTCAVSFEGHFYAS